MDSGDGDSGPWDGQLDLERAIAELEEWLPESLLPLARLAYNYRWSWLVGGPAVFRDVDAQLWRQGGCNPRFVIEEVPPHRLAALAEDRAYVKRVEGVAAQLEEDLARPALRSPIAPERPVAYFCSEFGVHCSLPLYGGGLGVLAGDLLKGASDLALPLVGIGLLYREGYFHQRLDTEGRQHEYWTTTSFEGLPAVPVRGPDRRPLAVEVEIRGRPVQIQVWRVQVGRVPLYLLDTDRPDNEPIDRWITARLYIGDRHTRLAQYAVLGVGGVKMLTAMGVRPGLVHLNEGHAALSVFERMKPLLANGRSPEEALAAVRATTVFTTHTPVAAGNEWYERSEVDPVLGALPDRLGLPRSFFYSLGRIDPRNDREPVSITPLAMRTSRTSNAVSRRHGEVARRMWRPMWPGCGESEVPITHVTNGVHTTSWMAEAMQQLLDRHLPPDWRRRCADPAIFDAVAAIPDADLWEVRRRLRSNLVETVRVRSVYHRLARGEAPQYVELASDLFGEDTLTLGFARRVATYKRLHLLVSHFDRALKLLSDTERPIQAVIAGKAHPQDQEAKEALRAILQMRYAGNVGARIVFLEDYDLHLAPRIVSGVDVWVNTPRPPLEACGTSGMKTVLNGALHLSVLDGWWSEGYDEENGWAIASPEADPRVQDDRDGTALFDLLEREVIPLFYERGPDGIPHRWLARVKASLQGFAPRFSTERMLREYVERIYAEPRVEALPSRSTSSA